MATVVIARRALSDLADLITTRSLPADTPARVRASIEPLASFPQIGKRLTGRWQGLRVILGPWAWMLLVYVYDEATDIVTIVAIHDARSAATATTGERFAGDLTGVYPEGYLDDLRREWTSRFSTPGVLIAMLTAYDADLKRAGEARSATGHHWRNR
jgi:plasmid stabilization system protein ParE